MLLQSASHIASDLVGVADDRSAFVMQAAAWEVITLGQQENCVPADLLV